MPTFIPQRKSHRNNHPRPTQRTPDTDWHAQAACRKSWVDPEWFFGQFNDNDGDSPKQTYGDNGLRARLICSTCPVFQQCWEENREAEFGIFAGTDETDRRRMVQAAQIKARRLSYRLGVKLPPPQITDLPVPRFNYHVATGSTAVQIALYAFLRGQTMPEAAAVAELPVETVAAAVTSGNRYCRYAA